MFLVASDFWTIVRVGAHGAYAVLRAPL